MGKKHKVYQSPTVRIQPLPKAFDASVSVSNLQEQKDRFLRQGKTPIFVVQGDTSVIEELAAKTSGRIRFDLLGEAEYILQTVKEQYGMGENYLEHIYGPRIGQDEANEILFDYIKENSLQESLAVYWSNEMTCSARMIWKGYNFKCNRPEARRYSLWLNGTDENPYLRREGLRCLLDHEIGTHFYRSYNDGLQPWFYDRKKFGLRGVGSFESLCTEEGLAAINTTLRAKEQYLWLSALVYYTACKSTEMTFKQLFDHLGKFLHNPEQRWKHVMRVKRGLIDPNDLGGYGKDQCYFEGAVTILRNIDNINFHLLMSGKICFDEVSRVKRVARLGSVCLPAIMRDMAEYRKQLKKMAAINGLHLPHPMFEAPRAYVQRLKERQAGVHRRRKVRKRKKTQASLSKLSCTGSEDSKSSEKSSELSLEHAIFAKYSCPDRKDFSSDGKGQSSNSKYSSSNAKGSSTVSKFSGLTSPVPKDTMTVSGLASAAPKDELKASAVASAVPKDSKCSRRASKVFCASADDITQAFVSDSKKNLDEQRAHTSSGRFDARTGTSAGEEQRPNTADELGKGRTSPLSKHRNEKMYHSPCVKENALQVEVRDGDSASPVSLKGLSGSFDDSLSIDQLSQSEEIESWLFALPPSFPSPSSVKSPSQTLPPIKLKQVNDSQVLNSQQLHAFNSSKPSLDTGHLSSHQISPPSHRCAKAKKSRIPSNRSWVTH